MDILIALVCRQHDNTRVGVFFPNGPYSFDAVHHGHPQVHQSDIWLMLTKQLHRLPAICRLGGNFHARLRLNDGGQATANYRMVIRDENSDLRFYFARHNPPERSGLYRACVSSLRISAEMSAIA